MLRKISIALILAGNSYSVCSQSANKVQQKADHSNCSNIVAKGNVNCHVVTSPERQISLKKRTEDLASQILEFVYSREGQVNSWVQQSMAQALLSGGDPHSSMEFQQRLNSLNVETENILTHHYWPQLATIKTDLASAGVDISPVLQAEGLNDPRRIGLMLSVLAGRIGKNPPFTRVLTAIEAKAIVEGNAVNNVEVYADTTDPNSFKIAEILRKEFQSQGASVNKVVIPLEAPKAATHGIHLIYAYYDLTTEANTFVPIFDKAELEYSWEVRKLDPPTLLRIEVWPTTHTELVFPPSPGSQLLK